MKVSDRAEYLGSGLLQQGLNPNPNTFIGIFAQNRPEVSVDSTLQSEVGFRQMVSLLPGHLQWIIGELACYTYSMVAVPLYDTLGPEALVFIIDRGNWTLYTLMLLIVKSESINPLVPRGPVLCARIPFFHIYHTNLSFISFWHLGKLSHDLFWWSQLFISLWPLVFSH